MLIHILYEKVIEYREAFMVELVRQVKGDVGVGRAHVPSLGRVESGLRRSIAWTRGWINAHSARTREPDQDTAAEDMLAEQPSSPSSSSEDRPAEPDGAPTPRPPDFTRE